MVGRWNSSWEALFSGTILVSGRVIILERFVQNSIGWTPACDYPLHVIQRLKQNSDSKLHLQHTFGLPRGEFYVDLSRCVAKSTAQLQILSSMVHFSRNSNMVEYFKWTQPYSVETTCPTSQKNGKKLPRFLVSLGELHRSRSSDLLQKHNWEKCDRSQRSLLPIRLFFRSGCSAEGLFFCRFPECFGNFMGSKWGKNGCQWMSPFRKAEFFNQWINERNKLAAIGICQKFTGSTGSTRKIVTNLSPPLQAMPLTPTPAGSGCDYRYSISHNVCDVVILGPICATKSFDGPAIAYVVASTNTVHQMRSSSCTSVIGTGLTGCWGWVYEGFRVQRATGRCEIGIHGPVWQRKAS